MPTKKTPSRASWNILKSISESLQRIEASQKLLRKEDQRIMAKVDEVLAKIKEVKDKVLALQATKDAGGMSAEEEAKVDAALADLSQTADPTQPNP